MKKLLIPFAALLLATPLTVLVYAVEPAPAPVAATDTPSATGGFNKSDGPLRRAIRGAMANWKAFHDETPLTADQKAKIKDIIVAHKSEIATQIQNLKAAHERMKTLNRQPAPIATDVNAAAARIGEVARDIALLHSKIVHEIRPLLTAEQVKRVDAGVDAFTQDLGQFNIE